MNKMVLRLLVGASGLLLLLALAACAPNGATTTTGSQLSSTTTASSAAGTSTADTTTATATTGATASSLPGNIPEYPGAKLSSSSVQNGVNTYLYTTPDSAAKVLDFYKQQMPANGWSEQQENGGVANVLEFTKGQQRAAITVMVPLPTTDPYGPALTTFSIDISG